MSAFDAWFDSFLVRLADADIASELEGFSLDELDAFEARCAVKLPQSYRRFLEVLGADSGALFGEVPLDRLAAITLELRAAGKLPGNAVVISSGTVPLWVVADGREDTEVRQEDGVAFGSVRAWLEATAAECLKALQT